ncbi:unnamed protein product [Adineta steineri]|uniref:Uncharacterized protein n=1 Tax=Adineta steineri TaxID=433720 RepID=A0A818V0A5_9BILA|nr:unnamed protein product [Adineta steineri]
MIATGLVLERVQELNVFKEITEIYIFVPALLANLRRRQGLFPATHCNKLVAYSLEPNSIQYIYQTRNRDEGDDNCITRTSHCGFIKLDWIYLRNYSTCQ